MTAPHYDRSRQDLGNVVNLGHVNVCITDQHLATCYYISGLGLTRDPFLNTGAGNMWVNVGMSQFHLPAGKPDILRGTTGLVVPDRAALLDSIERRRSCRGGRQREGNERADRGERCGTPGEFAHGKRVAGTCCSVAREKARSPPAAGPLLARRRRAR